LIPGYHPRLTYGLIILSILVALWSNFGDNFDHIRPLLITNFVNAGLLEVSEGQLWRLVTPIFVHFGILHIGLNMLWTWQLGTLIEYRRGTVLLAALVIVSGVISNLAEYYASGPAFGGMSGVIFALLGYLWIQGRFNPGFGIILNSKLVTMVMLWFVVCWSGILSYFGVHIANFAHTAGLLTGVLWGFIAAKSGNQKF
jgi:GlpG protein